MRILNPIVLSAAFCCVSCLAFAHARLTVSQPADGASLQTSPETISLHFSESLEPAFSHLTLTTASGDTIKLGGETVRGNEQDELAAAPTSPLTPGIYMIKWDVLSTDGHKTSGTRKFTVLP
ncbi:copper homeostasis periplasmic binding protein CopC [Agrobacterium vaccinii]|uniref:copper homeostasis periplasmic binding protein CopC n=1 Tax=Agrobacterium vaccinii TaxID=2735528 RepID=UPI001E30ACBF|nr:copper homeostasis periplasmic binding protein CopC [Agrobacterium vaccinii]UHS61295.1 copper homeostasis periplasmic binding protein CopC [Agrobacterium vaccinii]